LQPSKEKKIVKSSSKKIAITATFTALTIGLNLSPIKIPAPYAPFLIYQVWEIPIVAAFLLYGISVGILIAVVNTLVLLAIFPGALLTGPLYNLAAIFSMILGMFLGISLAKTIGWNSRKHRLRLASIATLFGVIFRVGIMSVVNWAFLRFPPPVGFSLTEEVILFYLPLITFFNATLALYTIPLGYAIAETIRMHLKI
jgi:riboflavin transporter FmnP